MSGEERVPTRHANYRGDVTAAIQRDIESGQPKGPNNLGEFLWPVTATYDPQADRTRVGFTYLPPASGAAS